MKTAIIILNYNNYEDTINCIESVEKFNTAPIKYIVVDNGSLRANAVFKLDEYLSGRFGSEYIMVEECKYKSNFLPYATLLISPTNDGYAKGNNKGLNLAYEDEEIDKILILNNDILFVEDIIPGLIDALWRLPQCAIISPILYKKDLREIDYTCARTHVKISCVITENLLHYWYRLLGKRQSKIVENNYILKRMNVQFPSIVPIELPSGSCMLIRKELFKEIDSFDPHTFLYYEENILYKKIQAKGLKNYLCTSLKCIHLGASTTSKSATLFRIDCAIKSLRYYAKEYSGCSKFLYAMLCLSTIFYRFTFVLQKKFMRKPIVL